MSLELLNKAFFVSLQDKGRFGYSHIGLTNGGVMDEFAYFMANKLLKNPKDTNILEIASSNVIFKVNKNTKIALSGANCEFYINDELKQIWKSYDVKRGDILKIGKIFSGNYFYLAVFGGFDIKKEFESNSTSIKENLGGIDGGFLKKGDILPFCKYKKFPNSFLKKEFIPNYEEELSLRIFFCYQENSFSKKEKEKFLNSAYLVTKDFNKMACKLSGEPIKSTLNGIISEGIAFGSVQITNDGQPIILLKDRQTIGGYPKIGVVLNVDCFRLSQVKIGSKIRFKEIFYSEGIEISKAFFRQF